MSPESGTWNTNTQIHKYTITLLHNYTSTQVHKYTNTQIRKYTNKQIGKYTNTKCLKDPICAIFLKSMGFEDIKYDIPMYQM